MRTTSYQTHLSVLKESATKFASQPVFRIPKTSTAAESEVVEEWQEISYAQFHESVDAYAKHWTHVFTQDGIPPRSVVGLWLGGMTYLDCLQIYAIARAGYIPQFFSLRLTNPDVVFELLVKAEAKALIYDLSYESALTGAPVPTHVAAEVSEEDVSDVYLPELVENPVPEDIVMIFHTSGSTSGSPKLVRCSFMWLDAMINKMRHTAVPRNPHRQDVTVWMGSMSHIAQTCMLLGSLQHGACTVQPTKIPFTCEELMDMITRCRLNRLYQFATFLSAQLRAARTNPKLLLLLQGLDEVVTSGLALPREDDDFATKHNINVRNMFGSTECGAMLVSTGGTGPEARLLKPIEGTDYAFIPVSSNTSSSSTDQSHINVNTDLRELVILSSSPDCPDPRLRSTTDGHFHTGDLFIEAAPGAYLSRGRDDDWIKSMNSLRCDTKAIEDNVRATCGDLVADCIVVGNGRPSPALFVEPKAGLELTEEKLKKDIIRRTRHFHSRRYLHERITAPENVILVPQGTLPRTATKGNIRRRAVEEAFRERLDNLFGMSF